MPQQGRRPWDDPPNEPNKDPQGGPQEGVELSPEPNQGAARGRRDKVTPARVEFSGGDREEEVDWRRELHLKEAQITVLSAGCPEGSVPDLPSLHHPRGG